MITPGISIKSLIKVNLYPKEEISKRRVEILVTHHAFIKMMMLLNLAPFFISTAVKGKAAYIGPAAIEPITIDRSIPRKPELFPIYFIRDSLEIHTSINPSITIIGGNTVSICIKLSFMFNILLEAKSKFKIPTNISTINKSKKNL